MYFLHSAFAFTVYLGKWKRWALKVIFDKLSVSLITLTEMWSTTYLDLNLKRPCIFVLTLSSVYIHTVTLTFDRKNLQHVCKFWLSVDWSSLIMFDHHFQGLNAVALTLLVHWDHPLINTSSHEEHRLDKSLFVQVFIFRHMATVTLTFAGLTLKLRGTLVQR